MSITRQDIRQEAAKKLYEGRWPVVSTTTATLTAAGSALTDSKLIDNSSDADAAKFLDTWLWITCPAPNLLSAARQVYSFAPTTGVLTVRAPWAFAADIASATAYEMHYRLHPDDLNDCVRRSFRNTRYKTYQPFTEVTDGDMEAANTTSWTASNSTLSKVTTAAYVKHGQRCLRVLNTGLAGYAGSVAIPVIEDQTWLVMAWLRSAVGTGTLVPYDATNSAVIEDEATTWATDESGWTTLGDLITIPSGCESMVIRLKGTGAADDIYWDTVVALNVNDGLLTLPSWVTKENHIVGIYEQARGEAASGGGFHVDRYWHQKTFDWETLPDETAATPWAIQVALPIQRPLFLYARRPWAELTDDTTTSNADLDTIVAGTLHFAHDKLGDTAEAAHWGKRWQDLRQEAGERPKVQQVSRYVSVRAR